MKPIVILAAVILTLASRYGAAAAQTIGTTYTVSGSAAANGSGCIDGGHPGAYQIIVKFKYLGPGQAEVQQLKVQFTEKKPWANQTVPVCAANGTTTGDVVYTLNTDNPLKTYAIEQFTPNTQLVVSSSGKCGAKGGTQAVATIRATITPAKVTIDCAGLNYTASGASKPPISFK